MADRARQEDDWAENVRLIGESARAIVPADGSLARIRACRFERPGFARETMADMAELGWFLIRVEEGNGGLGLGMREYCELARILGRGLVPEPFVASVLAHTLLQDGLPGSVANGRDLVVAAWQDATNSLAWRGDGVGGRPGGTKRHVQGAAGVDLFAVVTGAGVALVRRDDPGLSLDLAGLQDGTFDATLGLDGVDAEFRPARDVGAALDEAILAHSAYLLGVAERAFEMTTEYLKVREQFGQPIGSFQALQHRATELKIQIEVLRAGMAATAGRIDAGLAPGRRAAAVSRAKARAGDVAMAVAREAVQMHGAIGYTEEADVGLFVRKAMAQANRFGSARLHRARYLTHAPEAA